jgi:hypothetical protein
VIIEKRHRGVNDEDTCELTQIKCYRN